MVDGVAKTTDSTGGKVRCGAAMHRSHVLLALAVVCHVAWVATYDTGAGDLFGFVFVVLVGALVVPPVVRGVRRVRETRSGR